MILPEELRENLCSVCRLHLRELLWGLHMRRNFWKMLENANVDIVKCIGINVDVALVQYKLLT